MAQQSEGGGFGKAHPVSFEPIPEPTKTEEKKEDAQLETPSY